MFAPRARRLGASGKARSNRQAISLFGAFIAVVVALLVAAPLTSLTARAAPVSSQTSVDASNQDDWSPPRTVYIPETGQTIDGVFLDFWRANGGANAYGNPITPEFTMNGHTVQYYQYARFEYWPEDADGNVVHLGAIGEELRPQLVMRQGATATAPTAVAQMAQISLAWLPVFANVAKTPDSDTFT